MDYFSETEKLLLQKAEEIEAVVTRNSSENSWLEELEHFNTTCLDDSDARLLDAFYQSLVALDKNFHESRKSRYKDESVHEWKSFFRQKYNTFGSYTVWRVVFRDPGVDMDGNDMTDHIYFTPTLQVDIIDSAKRVVEHVTGTSMKDLCVKALDKVVSMFKLGSRLKEI